MFGIGKILFHEWGSGLACLGIAIVAGYVLKRLMAGMQFL
jgi:hypothetical protein